MWFLDNNNREEITLEPENSFVERIKSDPDFKDLVARRSTLAWTLTILMLLIYFGFILVIAFKANLGNWLGIPLFPGSITTIGIPIGVGVILSAFVLTGIYVRRANSTYDDLTKKIIEKVKK
jgi:uncharacterized membrane protein (DUF485 family)